MNRRALFLPAVLLGLSSGCAESIGPDPDAAVFAEAISPVATRGMAEGSVEALPAVRLYRRNGMTAEGRIVSFVLSGPDGAEKTVAVTTDVGGIAKLPAWQMGRLAGRYTATAVLEGMPPIVFTAYVRGRVVAVFDLQSIEGERVPSAGGLIEGHYILYEDGTYNRGYNRTVEDINASFSLSPYTWIGGEIRFYLGRGGNNTGLSDQFAHGLLNGNSMALGYTDYADFGNEVYTLRPQYDSVSGN